jgi:hypothetical protein
LLLSHPRSTIVYRETADRRYIEQRILYSTYEEAIALSRPGDGPVQALQFNLPMLIFTCAFGPGPLGHTWSITVRNVRRKKGELIMLVEKEIRAYQTKTKKIVCAECATDEERQEETPLVAEDVIHDPDPKYCIRCKKKIK